MGLIRREYLERRARYRATEARGSEHQGHQQTDGLGSQDNPQDLIKPEAAPIYGPRSLLLPPRSNSDCRLDCIQNRNRRRRGVTWHRNRKPELFRCAARFGYNPPTLWRSTIGQQLGAYEITALLGKGV